MSMETALLASALLGTGATVYQGERAKDEAKRARRQQPEVKPPPKQAARAPNVATLGAANAQRGRRGQSGTLLTGAQGLAPGSVATAGNTLLGQ